MLNVDFSPFGVQSIEIKFTCKLCGKTVESDSIIVPSPDFMAERYADSYSENCDFAYCECQEEYEICVFAGFPGGYIEIDKLDDNDNLEIIEEYEELDEYYEDQIDSILSSESLIFFNNEITKLKELNDIQLTSTELQTTLQRQIYSNAITCLEDYLSSTLIKKVMSDEKSFKNFVRTFHKLKNRKFTLNEIYERLKQLQGVVKKELLEIIYHNLPKVKGIFRDTLKIEFPSIKYLTQDIKKRHDMVHRNGKTKEGEIIKISKDIVIAVINRVENFVREIEDKMSNL